MRRTLTRIERELIRVRRDSYNIINQPRYDVHLTHDPAGTYCSVKFRDHHRSRAARQR